MLHSFKSSHQLDPQNISLGSASLLDLSPFIIFVVNARRLHHRTLVVLSITSSLIQQGSTASFVYLGWRIIVISTFYPSPYIGRLDLFLVCFDAMLIGCASWFTRRPSRMKERISASVEEKHDELECQSQHLVYPGRLVHLELIPSDSPSEKTRPQLLVVAAQQ